jgi:putative ABC transport system permease protein
MSTGPQDWTSAVRRHAVASGLELAEDVVSELAGHLEDVHLAAVAAGDSEDRAREVALATLQRATMSDLQRRRRAAPARQSRLLPRAPGTGVFQGLTFDLRYAARILRQSPVFSAVLIGILALSIGAITAVVSVVDAVLLRPLPYRAPDELVMVTRLDANGRPGHLSSADWLDYATRVSALAGVAVYANWTHNLSGDGEPLRLRSIITSGNFFAVLGAIPAAGRVYSDAEDRPNAAAVVVLSDGFWSRRFGRDPSAVGRTLTLNGRPAEIIGVMAGTFQFPSNDVDLWMPIGMGAELKADRASEWVQAVGRLHGGVSLTAAREETRAVAAALAATYPRTNANESATLTPLLDHVVGRVRPPLLMLAGAVLIVFLVTCLNAAGLLLARASLRQDEMTVRLAIGASTWRLSRQLLVESAVLTTCATIAGVAIGWFVLRAIAALAAARVPRIADATLDDPALLGAAAASTVIVGCCGLSAMLALRGGAAAPLHHGARLARGQGLRPVLLTAQIALSFMLVAGALLLAGSYLRLQQVPAGLDSDDVTSMRLTLPRQKYPDSAAHVRFVDAVLEQLSEIPTVRSVGVINDLPFAGNQMSFAVATDPANEEGTPPRATVRLASPGYFETLRIPVLRGRGIAPDDRDGAERIVVVNRSAAEQYWSGAAVGARVRVGDTREWRHVVGIVEDTRHAGVQQDEGPVIYLPYAQKPFDFVNWIGILVRAPDMTNAAAMAKTRIAAVDDTQPVYDVMLLHDYLARAQAPFRLNAWIVGGLAALSLLLAIAGVFALTAYNVAARRQEFGIRLTLGATSGTVLGLVLAHAFRFVLAGIVIGAVGALGFTTALTAVLFETRPNDPRVLAAVGIILAVAALVAALPPALRAARLDPASTIRAD